MKKILTGFFLLTLFFVLLCFPQEVKSGALDGLSLWYNSVVPILLPFLILSNLIIATDSLSLFLYPVSFIQKVIPGFQTELFYPVILGLFCGFPMGAKVIADLVRSHSISVKQADALLPIVNQASPMFLAGFVGVHILKKQLSFSQILFYLYVPPFFILAFRLLFMLLPLPISSAVRNSTKNLNRKKHRKEHFVFRSIKTKFSIEQKNSMPLNMEHTIWNSFHIVVTIGIYMMLFTISARICMKLLPKGTPLSLFLSSLEFSTGLDRISQMTAFSPYIKTGLILALTSFGGFCTAAQTSSLIKDTGISMKSYLFWKFLIALGVFFLYSSSVSSS
ncbi:MAG: hypothetical protein E7253_06550 [Lachnospiraceae bacterium]|nr:hypothetical protein [Lachnospiraceae bacterium]